MATPVLETRDLTIRFGGHLAVDRVSATFPGRHADRHRRAQRRRQDHLLQFDFGAAAGDRRQRAARRQGDHQAQSRCARAPGPRPSLPAHQPVPQPDRARERASRRAGARRRRRQHRLRAGAAAPTGSRRPIAFSRRPTLRDKRDLIAVALPHGDKRKLEVAIMMALEPHVFMFDEPTAGMSVGDVPVILDLIKTLEGRGQQDHSAGRAQDGGGAQPRRPHRRAAQRPARRRWCASRGHWFGDRPGGLSWALRPGAAGDA